MKIDQIVGFYVKYQESGMPVEVFDRQKYAFSPKVNRTVLVTNEAHLKLLLTSGKNYRIVGVEVAESTTVASGNSTAKVSEEKPKPEKQSNRGRRSR